MKDLIREALAFKELTPEEKEKRGILGRLYGPCADIINPTRNGRKYPDELWERVFKDELVQEALSNGGIFGELDHPLDRSETVSEKIAICMPEAPKKDKDGHLIAYFDILDTPCGRIAYALAKYGYKLGVSSRGNGDVEEDDDGNEAVVPETYDFKCFDLVITPSVKDARLTMTESLDTEKLQLKKALKEALDNSTEHDKAIMNETLENLNIKLDENKNECISESCADKLNESSEQTQITAEEASDAGSNELVKSLQEAIIIKATLEAEVRDLQEKLAVSNAKVDQLTEDLNKHKSVMITLSAAATKGKALNQKIATLEESLKEKTEKISIQESRIVELETASNNISVKSQSLNESISSKESEIKKLNESIDLLVTEHKAELDSLTEALENQKKADELTISALKEKLQKQSNLTESYKKLANSTVNHYIESKATLLGVKPIEIKNRLAEHYSVNDIDAVCEDMKTYSRNMSKIPFNLDNKVKIRVTESKNDALAVGNPDDDVDETFLNEWLR